MALCPFVDLTKEMREVLRLYHFEPKVCKKEKNECWRWTGLFKTTRPYGYVSKKYGKKSYLWYAHRLAWMFRYNSPIPNGLNCCHTCDNTWCVNPEHIFLGTQRQNLEDARRKGRMYNGKPRKSRIK
jgi:hypothetical protein